MLLRSIVVVSIYTIFFFENSGSVRIYFSKCDSGGFTCSINGENGTLALSLTCPRDDITIYIHKFKSPSNIESLEIKECKNVTVSFQCANIRNSFKFLTIKNVSVLKIETQYPSIAPKILRLENINYIEEIPSFAFSHLDQPAPTCGEYKGDFRQMFLENVTINTIQSNSFRMVDKCENFSMQSVKVNRVQTSAILVVLKKGANFKVENSEMGIVEHLAFRVTGTDVTFRHNQFADLGSSGINGTIENFTFSWNFVNVLQSYGISILCTNAKILHNKIQYMKSNALEKIGPGLLEDSNKSFGDLRFFYEFRSNVVNYMDFGCLHPDYMAYTNVASKMIVKKNAFLCSCSNIGWIFPGNSHGHNSKYLESFKEMLVNEDNGNVCLSSCNFPLPLAMDIFRDGKCPEIDIPDLICTRTTNPIPTAPPPKAVIKETSAKLSKRKSYSSSVKLNRVDLSSLLLLILIFKFTS